MLDRHRSIIVASLVYAILQAMDVFSTLLALSVTSTLMEGNAIFVDPAQSAPLWTVMILTKIAYTSAVIGFSVLVAAGTRIDWLGSLPIWYCAAITGRTVFANFFLTVMECVR